MVLKFRQSPAEPGVEKCILKNKKVSCGVHSETEVVRWKAVKKQQQQEKFFFSKLKTTEKSSLPF